MDAIVFRMAGAPKGKGRPRARVQIPKSGAAPFAQLYTDDATRKYEASAKRVAVAAMGDVEPFTGALSVSIRFRLPLPKSMSKRDRAAALSGERAYLGHIDIDNMAKSILDACNGVCWIDDAQIVRLFLTKTAAEKPGIDVRVEPLEPQDIEARAVA